MQDSRGHREEPADFKGRATHAGTPARRTFAFDRLHPELLQSRVSTEGFPSGQREQTVNLPALPSKVRILPPPLQEPGIRGQETEAPAIPVAAHRAPVLLPDLCYLMRGCSTMVEQKPSKLTTRVRFPSPAPGLQKGVPDSRLRTSAHVAQWQSTPLVRERSCVQSAPWAPKRSAQK